MSRPRFAVPPPIRLLATISTVLRLILPTVLAVPWAISVWFAGDPPAWPKHLPLQPARTARFPGAQRRGP